MATTIESYDAVSFLPSPLPFGNQHLHLDYMSTTSNIDALDQYSNFDSETYVRCVVYHCRIVQDANNNSGDEMSYSHGGGLAQRAMMKRMSSSYDEFATQDHVPSYDQLPGDGESPSMDRDSKYLSFSMPSFPYRLFNESFQQCYINIQAQLHGMFFLAESQWPTTLDTAPPPPELTCYRRNLFQITGNVTIPKNLRYVFMEDGRRLPIFEMELVVSASESVEGNPVKIISVPWKTPTGGESTKADEKAEKEPPALALDRLSAIDTDSDFNSIPIQWKRLQFRIATANNGRRKELQQHFLLHLKVLATVSTGEKMSIAESRSGAIIVRGRSPRNFAARKDVPLSSSSTSRKHVPGLSRSADSATSVPKRTTPPTPAEMPRSHPVFDSTEISKPEIDLNGWQHSISPFPLQEPSPSYSMSMNLPAPLSFIGAPSPDIAQTPFNFAFSPNMPPENSAPVSLHFQSDDESVGSPSFPPQQSSRTPSRPPTSNPSPHLNTKPHSTTYAGNPDGVNEPPSKQRPRTQSHQKLAISQAAIPPTTMSTGLGQQDRMPRPPLSHAVSHTSNPHMNDSANGLYEYFPLTLDEWQPPVDAVFRPHVVHHELPIDPRSPSGRSSKRYFSEVV